MATYASVGTSNQRNDLKKHQIKLDKYATLLNKIAEYLKQTGEEGDGEEIDSKQYLIRATEILKKIEVQKRYFDFEINLNINKRNASISSKRDISVSNMEITPLLEQLERIEEYNEDGATTRAIIEEIFKRVNNIDEKKYKIYNTTDSTKLCNHLELFKEGTTFYISLNYRVNNINTITKKVLDLTTHKGALDVLTNSIVDYKDKCGVLGNTCASINEGFNVFLYLINNVFSDAVNIDVEEVGNIIMSNDIMIQKYKLVKKQKSNELIKQRRKKKTKKKYKRYAQMDYNDGYKTNGEGYN